MSKFVYLLSLLTAEAKLSVKGLTISEAHYQIAKDILVQRYGRKEHIIFTHVQQLMNITVPGNQNCENTVLWKLQDELLAHVRSLEALGVTGDQYGVILTPLILSRLPQDVRLEWAREDEGRESDLDWLLTFLASEINRRERSQSFRDTTTHDPVATTCEEKVRSARKASASALHVHSSASGSEDVQVSCDVCGVKGHTAERCWNLTKLSTGSERRSKMQMCGLCFRCIRRGHVAKGCLNKCDKCGGRHHVLLCDPRPTSTQEKCSTSSTSRRSDSHIPVSHYTEQKHTNSNLSLASHYNVHANSKESKTKRVILQTTDMTASGCRVNRAFFTVLFDTGSDRSYDVSSRLVKRVEPEWVGTQQISYSAFGTDRGGKCELRNVFHVNLKCADDSYVSLFATEIPTICAPVYRPDIPLHVLQSFEQLSIEADCSGGGEVQVDVLIGLDSYCKFMKSGIVRNTGGLVAEESVFGWVLSGSLFRVYSFA